MPLFQVIQVNCKYYIGYTDPLVICSSESFNTREEAIVALINNSWNRKSSSHV